MNYLKVLATAFFSILIAACDHPIEIKGSGDVLSTSGNHDCYLEDYNSNKESCVRNIIVGEYAETYYAAPRDGWKFDKWHGCQTVNDGLCSFSVPANAVFKAWGITAPPLIAVFLEEGTSNNPSPISGITCEQGADGGECIDYVRDFFGGDRQSMPGLCAINNDCGAYNAYGYWDLGFGQGKIPRANSIMIIGKDSQLTFGHAAVVVAAEERTDGKWRLTVQESNWSLADKIDCGVIYTLDSATMKVSRNDGRWLDLRGFIYSAPDDNSSLLGSWFGNVYQPNVSSRYPDGYSARLTFRRNSTGEIFGESEYPTLNCGGALSFVGSQAETFTFYEDVEGGRCLDGQFTVKLIGENSVYYNWEGGVAYGELARE